MATGSNIEWTEATWQVTSGCTKVSPGCKNCYAETMAKRLAGMARADVAAGRNPGRKASYPLVVTDAGAWNNKVVTLPNNLTIPLKRKKPCTYYVNSMSDLFHEDVPFEFVDRVFAVMALSPQHTFQVPTKWPERMAEYLDGIEHYDGDIGGADGGYRLGMAAAEFLDGEWIHHEGKRFRSKIEDFIADTHNESGDDGDPDIDPECFYEPKPVKWPLPNVWLGTSVENQECADTRIPHLLKCPAAVRFLSCEPLLSSIELGGSDRGDGWCHYPLQKLAVDFSEDDPKYAAKKAPGIHWVIVGGESGGGSRPCKVEWVRSIVKQCAAAGVPVFTKQMGAALRMDFEEWKERWMQHTDKHGFTLDAPHSKSGIWKGEDVKGGNPDEWAADLRVRQMPDVRPVAAVPAHSQSSNWDRLVGGAGDRGNGAAEGGAV